MKWKRPILKNQFFQIYPKLHLIICDLDYYAIRNFEKEIVITSLIRKGDKGVHGYGRGADIRCEYGRKRYFTKKEIALILEYINGKYAYDVSRPRYKTIIYHKVEGSTHHLHVQVLWKEQK